MTMWKVQLATTWLGLFLATTTPLALGEVSPTMLVVVGAPGTPEYGSAFSEWADRWRGIAEKASLRLIEIGNNGEASASIRPPESGEVSTDRQALRHAIDAHPAGEPLWIILIGHGTYDGDTAKFNLQGPDFSARELGEWLKGHAGDVVIINCSAASGPFISALSAPRRIIVTATKSGDELNFARFGDYLSSSLLDLSADIDKDGQASLLEAFLAASRQTNAFYENAGRLATEHALMDDNGDAIGTSASAFDGLRSKQKGAEGSADGREAQRIFLIRSGLERTLAPELRERRDRLESELEVLRGKKKELDTDEYYRELERIMLELARIYTAPASMPRDPTGSSE